MSINNRLPNPRGESSSGGQKRILPDIGKILKNFLQEPDSGALCTS
jgi:hypothetical protein